jgi:hypothetical protein
MKIFQRTGIATLLRTPKIPRYPDAIKLRPDAWVARCSGVGVPKTGRLGFSLIWLDFSPNNLKQGVLEKQPLQPIADMPRRQLQRTRSRLVDIALLMEYFKRQLLE